MSCTRTALGVTLWLHQRLYQGSHGRVGHHLFGLPCLLLYTTGRKSGAKRVAALVYAQDRDDRLVVVASNGGDDRAPGWLHNLQAAADVEVQIARRHFPAHAIVIRPCSSHYQRLWSLVNLCSNGRYESYQHRTKRLIPLVVLTPHEAQRAP